MTVQHRHPPGRYRLSVDDFMRLDEAGSFGTARTELLDGEIIIMNAEYRPHAWIVGELGYSIRRALEAVGRDLHVMSASIALSDHDMPLPDLVLTREPRGAGPIPCSSVALVGEVASTTMDRDMRGKVSAYAQANIPEYWIVDVSGQLIHQMWAPIGDRFTQSRDVAFGTSIQAATIPDLMIETATL